jgi:hypothetical protein
MLPKSSSSAGPLKAVACYLKPVIPTLLFYAAATIVIILLSVVSPNGPCVPGLGVLSFFLLFFIAAILLMINFYQTVSKGNKYLPKTIVHAIVLITIVTMLSVN